MHSEPRRGRGVIAGIFLLLFLAMIARDLRSEVLQTMSGALSVQFQQAEVVRESVVLSPEQISRASDLAGHRIGLRIVRLYKAWRNGALVGTAYFDVHRVRTLKETLMVVVDPEHRVADIELLTFMEPVEYIPRERWYGQFVGRKLDRDLHLHRGIDGVVGATLTARATSDAVRRILAVHSVLHGVDEP